MIYFVVACGADKGSAAAPARELYTSPNFRHMLAAAEAEAVATERDTNTPAAVLILSARYGLVAPEEVLAPYDTKMGDADAISLQGIAATAAELHIGYGDELYAMLPRTYREALTAALDATDVPVFDVFEASPGIGYQRGTAASLARTAELVLA
jgi:hypothetical protein